MSIDVGCGREGAVSEPDLNLFHGDSLTEKQTGTGMPKVMESWPQIATTKNTRQAAKTMDLIIL